MTVATVPNHKPPRKQLSDQLDRLDGIIDALAEGLNGAVADAAREGTRLAVKDAIVEILSNPELRALIAPPVIVPAASSAPSTSSAALPLPEPALEPTKPGVWAQ